MIDWPEFLASWEAETNSILASLPQEQLFPAEERVLLGGLRIAVDLPNSEEAALRLEALGLAAELDYVEFLSTVGSIHLLALGADDGVLLPASGIGDLNVLHPSLFSAWMATANSTSMDKYSLNEPAVDEILVFPREVICSSVVISSGAGGLVHVAAPVGDGNDYVRLSTCGNSMRFSSFEEFMYAERDRVLGNLEESVHGRLE